MTARHYFTNTMAPSLFYGTVAGVITGAVIWGYKYIVEQVLKISGLMYDFVNKNLAFLPLLIAVLLIGGFLSYLVSRVSPEVKGGGVPYAEGAARGLLPLKWYKVAPSVVAGSCLAFVCGLPLGSEGPSVLIGASMGSGANSLLGRYDKKRSAWSRISITAGASAGFATAIGAPLAGILFALEECQKKFSPVVLLTSAVAVPVASLISSLLTALTGVGEAALFTVGTVYELGLAQLHLPIIAGIIAGLFAVGLSFLLRLGKKLAKKIKINRAFKVMAAYLLSGMSCLIFMALCGVNFIGGGGAIISGVGQMQYDWWLIFAMLIVKVILLVLCSSSEVTGGMFIPFLCLGALSGGLLGKIMVLCGMSEIYYATIVVITMCAFLGSMLKAPITSVVLIVELVGGISSLLFSIIAIVAAYLVSELFHTKPFYDEVLEGIIKRRREGKEVKKVEIELTVKKGSYAVGKVLRDILLPTTVVAVVHKDAVEGEHDLQFFSRNERIIAAGDVLVFEAHTMDEQSLRAELNSLFETGKSGLDRETDSKE